MWQESETMWKFRLALWQVSKSNLSSSWHSFAEVAHRYRLQGEVGSGSYSEVYAGVDDRTGHATDSFGRRCQKVASISLTSATVKCHIDEAKNKVTRTCRTRGFVHPYSVFDMFRKEKVTKKFVHAHLQPFFYLFKGFGCDARQTDTTCPTSSHLAIHPFCFGSSTQEHHLRLQSTTNVITPSTKHWRVTSPKCPCHQKQAQRVQVGNKLSYIYI